jgi:hypothetical protein
MRFFIRDCNDNIVGNPKGYATMRGAQAQLSNWKSPAARAVLQAYAMQENDYIAKGINPEDRQRLYSSIRGHE